MVGCYTRSGHRVFRARVRTGLQSVNGASHVLLQLDQEADVHFISGCPTRGFAAPAFAVNQS
jgi:hypothetical protein